VGVFIQNARQFVASRINIVIHYHEQDLKIRIEDDGPGFDPELLPQLGRPYISSRIDNGPHKGLGIFIAQNLLEQEGIKISYTNKETPAHGAIVTLTWKDFKNAG
jgi:two-component system sensor histidine kinase RegB